MMDTLLSPRRRTVLQAMAAASLLAACGDRRVGAPPRRRCRTGARRWARSTR